MVGKPEVSQAPFCANNSQFQRL